MRVDDFKQYPRKPVVRRAVRFDPDGAHRTELPPGVQFQAAGGVVDGAVQAQYWYIRNAKGEIRVYPGDWIVYGSRGEVYPVSPEAFEESYEEA